MISDKMRIGERIIEELITSEWSTKVDLQIIKIEWKSTMSTKMINPSDNLSRKQLIIVCCLIEIVEK